MSANEEEKLKTKIKNLINRLIPAFLKRMIIYDWKVKSGWSDFNFNVSYSQQAEDLHIDRFFGEKNHGFYVDIGAFHPIIYSNTYKFFLKGWRGINIEPNPDQFNNFCQLRTNDINLNCAIGEKSQTLLYYKFNSPAINSFDIKHVRDWSSRPGIKLLEAVPVETVSLVTILDDYLPPNTAIDFMTVDVEGWDIKVLSSNNWEKYRPLLLLVECYLDENCRLADMPLSKFLGQHDYSLWAISGGTIFFRDNRKSG